PVLTGVAALALFGVSFFLPEGESDIGRACSCGCDFHRCPLHGHERRPMGIGALVYSRRMKSPKLSPSAANYHTEPYGFLPALPAGIPAESLYDTGKAKQESNSYRYKLPILQGATLRRQSGYGKMAAVRWEAARELAAERL
ncbi:MAG: hypothetical protein Q7T05_00855, partial [Dehalococcoidia bacterium]|nr:hypothetical protein [Dehalococcoidia bacterium]